MNDRHTKPYIGRLRTVVRVQGRFLSESPSVGAPARIVEGRPASNVFPIKVDARDPQKDLDDIDAAVPAGFAQRRPAKLGWHVHFTSPLEKVFQNFHLSIRSSSRGHKSREAYT